MQKKKRKKRKIETVTLDFDLASFSKLGPIDHQKIDSGFIHVWPAFYEL